MMNIDVSIVSDEIFYQRKQENEIMILRLEEKLHTYNYLSRTDNNLLSTYREIRDFPDIRYIPIEIIMLIIEYAAPSECLALVEFSTTCKLFRYVLFLMNRKEQNGYVEMEFLQLQGQCHLFDRYYVDTIIIDTSDISSVSKIKIRCNTLYIKNDDDSYSDGWNYYSSGKDNTRVPTYIENISCRRIHLDNVRVTDIFNKSIRDRFPYVQEVICHCIPTYVYEVLSQRYPDYISVVERGFISICITEEICNLLPK